MIQNAENFLGIYIFSFMKLYQNILCMVFFREIEFNGKEGILSWGGSVRKSKQCLEKKKPIVIGAQTVCEGGKGE